MMSASRCSETRGSITRIVPDLNRSAVRRSAGRSQGTSSCISEMR
jgi:hypothetical protein